MCMNEIWDSLRKRSRDIEQNMNPLKRKRTGSYYTDLELTDKMMAELVFHLSKGPKKLCDYRFLEPCVGAGNFVFSYIDAVDNQGITKDEAEKLINNIYVADINFAALNMYKKSLREIVRQKWGFELSDDYFSNHVGTGLLIDVMSAEPTYISIQNVFPNEIVKDGFDVVATNPPYKNLKAEHGHYDSDDEYEKDKIRYNIISKLVKSRFNYSTSGSLNLYKIFVEEILDQYTNKNGYVSLLIPATILSDKTCTGLRTHLLKENQLLSVKFISEKNNYIDAQQALSAVLLHKGNETQNVNITKDYCNAPDMTVNVNINDILNKNTGNAIFAVSNDEYIKLKKLRAFPTVKDLGFINNLRGELDLTLNKEYISSEETSYPLIRGRNIGYYELISAKDDGFVNPRFIDKTQKKRYIFQERIACQQISNIHRDRRVKFSVIPSKCVLGNSCNFISVDDNEYGIDLYTILGLFNTKIINDFFKLTSSNNHINNYEIDGFPVPIGAPELNDISALTKLYLQSPDEGLLNKIEKLSRYAYGIESRKQENDMDFTKKKITLDFYHDLKYLIPHITEEEIKAILKHEQCIEQLLGSLNEFNAEAVKALIKKYVALYDGKVLNHNSFKLSTLDLEMISAVPQGGNWKNIPQETVEKSKRLKKITQTGGRTTLYGRIDYNKPSYTITTYFNRPGNGTYIHTVHQRVLSVREAARFQTFRDDYYFYGNKTQLLKQVGNAVPTLLAYQIGKRIKKVTGCSKSIDLFCGAGGMTAGFKAAGIQSLLSNDIEKSACITLKINNPEIPVLCGDITTDETKKSIEKIAKKGGADIICGGPPCQGFSMAGYRASDDPRNLLFKEFVEIVKQVNPKVIVFENVEGILSYQQGRTYREVHSLFSELGYATEGRKLLASEYGVPQKRKRVIIICTRKDLNILPANLYPEPLTVEENQQITAKETISDLENVPCDENAKYSKASVESCSAILKFLLGKYSYGQYVDAISTKKIKASQRHLKNEPIYEQTSLSF